MTSDDLLVVFLDSNVLAKPVTRTLVLRCAASGYTVRWSRTAEEEAGRHLIGRKLSIAGLRALVEIPLSPTAADSERFTRTSADDRQILADAEAAGATFLVTEDVDDFAELDLRTAGVTAVNPDLFLAARADREVYRRALEVMVSGMTNPSRTPAELHAAIARQHPKLFQRYRDLFEVEPQGTGHRPRSAAASPACAVQPDSLARPWPGPFTSMSSTRNIVSTAHTRRTDEAPDEGQTLSDPA